MTSKEYIKSRNLGGGDAMLARRMIVLGMPAENVDYTLMAYGIEGVRHHIFRKESIEGRNAVNYAELAVFYKDFPLAGNFLKTANTVRKSIECVMPEFKIPVFSFQSASR